MPLKLNSTSGGSVTLQEPTTASNRTLTLPDNTGTVLSTASTFAGTGPAFSAYASTGTAVSAETWTKITFDTESFDTNSNFASSRFTPTVAGYYGISACIGVSSTLAQNIWIAIYKNGSVWQYGSLMTQNISVGGLNNMAGLVYCNGSTDYIEIYGLSSVAQTLSTGVSITYFNGAMVRAA